MNRTALLLGPLLVAAMASSQGGWIQRSPATHPPGRQGHDMAYDSARGVTVLFGGGFGSGWSDTWEYDGTDWGERHPTTAPPPRRDFDMAYDSRRGVVVLFGGWLGTGTELDDTWEWDGTNWAQRTSAVHPTPRADHAMAFDDGRGVVVLFGGANGSGTLDDTWEWDGASWTERVPAIAPTRRSGHAMAYELAHRRVLLFGGLTSTGILGDTWDYDGTSWRQLNPPNAPANRVLHGMAHDDSTGITLLFGGSDLTAGSGKALDDTWEWNGQTWRQAFSQTRPLPRLDFDMAYDSRRQRTVIFGGWDASSPEHLADTWEYDSRERAVYEAFGSGCPGSSGIPALAAVAGQVPRIGEVFSAEVTNLTVGVDVFMFVGLSAERWGGTALPVDLTPIGMIGCTVYTDDIGVFRLTNSGGTAIWSLRIPNLLGAVFYNQALAFDAAANPFGIIASNAAKATIGD